MYYLKLMNPFYIMKIIRYITKVDSDVKYDPKKFAEEVALYLNDPDGWVSEGYDFEEVTTERPDTVIIRLSSPKTLLNNNCRRSDLSCADLGGKHMYLNSMRWTQGSKDSKLSLDDYRQYVVSHEMGHITCPGRGHPAPIMMQQTIGIGQCKPNTKLTAFDTTQ